ncbi:MAG: hypothetical protein MK226_09310 [Saprospiraceae bacterium]|nr:hypothetical protein [Saprospiraceae bacterium]
MELKKVEDLSENDVKRVGLQFLKAYYKYRPRVGEAVLSIDMRGKGGIIADGLLSFPLEDGSKFQATMEATSYDTRTEVLFQRQKRLLSWDATAVALVGIALLFVYAYLEDFWTVKEWGTWPVLFGLLLSIFLLGFTYFIAFGWGRRYRYIYAIEQFKQYYANEQWIVIGEDVFISTEDDYYKELKDQCIYNGFGLLMVMKDHTPVMVATPARQSLLKKERKTIEFISQNELSRRIQEGIPGDWKKWFNKGWGTEMMNSFAEINRFRQSYQYQITFSAIAIALIIFIFYEEYKERPIFYHDRTDYIKIVADYKDKLKGREPLSYELDTPHFFPLPLIIDSEDIPSYRDLQIQSNRRNSNRKTSTFISDFNALNTDILVTTTQPRKKVGYDCARFYNIHREKFLIIDAYYDTFEQSNQRVSLLNNLGMDANALWMGCFYRSEVGYAVFLGQLYNSPDEAGYVAEQMAQKLARKNMEIQLRIVSLSPKELSNIKK